MNIKSKKNLILAFNKIDTIGETEDPNDPDLRWNTLKISYRKIKKSDKSKIVGFN